MAHAQDDVVAAKAHYSKATRLYEVGEYRQALAEFKEAHVAKSDPAFLYNIAQCHRQLGELEQAVVMYKRFLAASPRASNRAEVEKRIADIESDLADGKAKTGMPNAAAAPAPTTAGETPLAQPIPAAATPAPSPAPYVPAQEVMVARPVASSSSLTTWRWIGAGLTVALAGAAVATGLSASTKYDDLKSSCGATPDGCSNGQIDSLKSRARITNILWGAAGVAAVGTGILFWLTPSEAKAQVAWSF